MSQIHKDRLPVFPRTPHLPYNPNMDASDIIADKVCFDDGMILIEEKVDGASVGLTLDDEGNPVIRNRDHILNKGYVKKNTTAKKQFRPLWNYFYDNRRAFENILKEGPFSIYGEWMWAQHGIHYDSLPDWLIPYDIYNYEVGEFLSPVTSRRLLTEAGFHCPALLFRGLSENLEGYEELEKLTRQSSKWADSEVEGIYLKVHNDDTILHRYKMVREDFARGALWDNKELKKNELAR